MPDSVPIVAISSEGASDPVKTDRDIEKLAISNSYSTSKKKQYKPSYKFIKKWKNKHYYNKV